MKVPAPSVTAVFQIASVQAGQLQCAGWEGPGGAGFVVGDLVGDVDGVCSYVGKADGLFDGDREAD